MVFGDKNKLMECLEKKDLLEYRWLFEVVVKQPSSNA